MKCPYVTRILTAVFVKESCSVLTGSDLHSQVLIVWNLDIWRDGQTDGQKATPKSPPCMSTGGLKNGPAFMHFPRRAFHCPFAQLSCHVMTSWRTRCPYSNNTHIHSTAKITNFQCLHLIATFHLELLRLRESRR